MRASTAVLLIIILACIPWTWSCEPDQSQNGCKIYGVSCACGYGCKTEFIYRTRRMCLNALKDRTTSVCTKKTCATGICIQTGPDPGYICRCEGTGYYGQHCEKACPTTPKEGEIFPVECVVI